MPAGPWHQRIQPALLRRTFTVRWSSKPGKTTSVVSLVNWMGGESLLVACMLMG